MNILNLQTGLLTDIGDIDIELMPSQYLIRTMQSICGISHGEESNNISCRGIVHSTYMTT